MELNKLYNQITMKTTPILLIIFLSFIVLFSETKLTIIATKLSNILLVVLLTITQIFLYSLLNYNYNHNYNHNYKIYMILLCFLITFMLLYILYIKRIYDEEFKIITQLKEKDIIEDTNVAC